MTALSHPHEIKIVEPFFRGSWKVNEIFPSRWRKRNGHFVY
jgi:hypothetical protein